MRTSRRNFITKSILAAAGVSAGLNSMSKANGSEVSQGEFTKIPVAKVPDAFSISIFSKHLHWLDYREMAMVAAEIGFDGVDLTVRPQGHVLPERVEEDLPKAVEAVIKAGLIVNMITTSVKDAGDPITVKVLKTASSLGIQHYRMDWFNYDDKISIEENLKVILDQMRKLAALNEKFSISGEYQNHSGNSFGASIWDLYMVLKDVKSPWIGSQYDILHATVEGANSWVNGLKALRPFIRSIDIKDFQWEKKDGKWKAEVVPLGEGMVDFKRYLGLVKQYNLSGPVSMHFEYPLGGAENGAKTLTMKREQVISAMQKDITLLRKYLKEANLV
jgi:L-ribulose-5-phosphate 3-epimerase